MKGKKMKKLMVLMGVSLLVYGTSFNALNNVNATLTSGTAFPFDIAYRNNGSTGSYGYYSGDNVNTVNNWNWTTPDIVSYYNRVANGSYYNYTHVYSLDNFDISHLFQRSNTGWLSTPSGYTPYLASSIGSNSGVGITSAKLRFDIYNKTDRDYTFILDLSSTNDTTLELTVAYNSTQYYNNSINSMSSSSSLQYYYLPAFSLLTIQTSSTSSSRYFDAWYLMKGNINPAFDVGYNEGESDTIIGLNGMNIFGVIGLAFGGVASIFNITILPNITLGTVFGAIIAIAVLFSFLNLVNATPSKGKK
jgi:hypothetical protein